MLLMFGQTGQRIRTRVKEELKRIERRKEWRNINETSLK